MSRSKITSHQQLHPKYSATFSFGKYRHKTVLLVLATDPSYIVWLYENHRSQNLVDGDIYQEARQKIWAEYEQFTSRVEP